jgi:hypothetical protein
VRGGDDIACKHRQARHGIRALEVEFHQVLKRVAPGTSGATPSL